MHASTAAFNGFLKLFEEPTVHAIFILATTENKVLFQQFASQVFDFNRISIPDIVKKS